ncbi:MAG TPA: hypothetical protein VL475_03200, partial [Planctomycetaceae bacterium]|nr:hypothetical protein [Planctomycetaceae bacterium]
VPPRRESSATDEKLIDDYVARLKDESQKLDFQIIDSRESGLVASDDFSDAVHLNAQGARRFSRVIGAALPKPAGIKAADSTKSSKAAIDSSQGAPPGEGD